MTDIGKDDATEERRVVISEDVQWVVIESAASYSVAVGFGKEPSISSIREMYNTLFIDRSPLMQFQQYKEMAHQGKFNSLMC